MYMYTYMYMYMYARCTYMYIHARVRRLLQGVHSSSDMFQTLCVTPDSVAFDCCGTVCFLDLAAGASSRDVMASFC